MLTDDQVKALVAGMRKEWSKPNVFAGVTSPPYEQPSGGDGKHGEQVYQARCASCHQGSTREQLTGAAYLALVSDQALRTVILAGRTDIGQPDWRMAGIKGSNGNGNQDSDTPLSPQDVTDVVTYLGSLRNSASVSAGPDHPDTPAASGAAAPTSGRPQ
jgi:cytochrome c oxidase cbb3-type subunit III